MWYLKTVKKLSNHNKPILISNKNTTCMDNIEITSRQISERPKPY